MEKTTQSSLCCCDYSLGLPVVTTGYWGQMPCAPLPQIPGCPRYSRNCGQSQQPLPESRVPMVTSVRALRPPLSNMTAWGGSALCRGQRSLELARGPTAEAGAGGSACPGPWAGPGDALRCGPWPEPVAWGVDAGRAVHSCLHIPLRPPRL